MLRRSILPNVPKTNGLVFSIQLICVQDKALWIYGVTLNGESVSIKVPDFRMEFYVKAPDEWEHEDVDQLQPLIDEWYQETFERPCKDQADVVTATPAVGFTNGRQDRLIRIKTSVGSHHFMVNKLKSNEIITYHSDWSPACQFLFQKKLKYYDWIQCSNLSEVCQNKITCVSATVLLEHIKPYTGSTPFSVPSTLKAFLRIKTVSREGMLSKRFAFVPRFDEPCDRIVCISVCYCWAHDMECNPAREITFALFDAPGALSFPSESELLSAFARDFTSMDPDEVFVYPDVCDELAYIQKRMDLNGVSLSLGRRARITVRQDRQSGEHKGEFEDRNLLWMNKPIQPRNLELYDLYSASCVYGKKIRKEPEKKANLLWDNDAISRWMLSSVDRPKIVEMAQQDVRLIRLMERDMGMRLEQANLGAVTDTNLSVTCNKGQQQRLGNMIENWCRAEGFYLNREMLSSKPLKYNSQTHPPTFVEPPELELNIKARQESNERMEKLYVKTKVKKTKQIVRELEGGSVLPPVAGFYEHLPIAILDFSSLYPAIERGYGVCSSNLVYDAKYLDLPDVQYLRVAINSSETVVYAQAGGLLPKMQTTLTNTRTAIRNAMKEVKDPFLKAVMDSRQLAAKVTSNALYGSLGSADSKLCVKELMYSTTSIGRYLQRTCVHHVGKNYAIPAAGGDTDSFFAVASLCDGPIEQVVAYAADRYKMNEWAQKEHGSPFSWNTVREHFKTLEVDKWTYEQQRLGVLYLVYEKLAAECTALFRHPICLNFENLILRMMMYPSKKLYQGLALNEKNPTIVDKIKITGMASKKREWCAFTRSLLSKITNMILYDQIRDIRPLLETRLMDLAHGRVSMEDLIVTKLYKGKAAYKAATQLHTKLAENLEKDQGSPLGPQRIPYVVLRGNTPLYTRGHHPKFPLPPKAKIDLEYYFTKQLEQPLRKLLMFHFDVVNPEPIFAKAKAVIHQRSHGIQSLFALPMGVKRKEPATS